MRHLSTALKTIGLVTAVGLVGNSVSLAATGQGLVLGKGNTAKSATGIQRTTTGPVLSLKNKRATDAPFAVNGRGRVINLNADRLDGLDSTAFARATTTTALTARVDGIEAKATQAGVNAITPQLPIAQAVILQNGTPSTTSKGIATSTWNAAESRYEITFTQAPSYIYTRYLTQVTPVTALCSATVTSLGGKLLVSAVNMNTALEMQCAFMLTVTPL